MVLTAQRGYASYYSGQLGNGIDIYTGRVGQRGHGLGGMLSGLLRGITPMFKSLGGSLAKGVLKTGLNVMNDLSRGGNIREAFKRRGREAGLDFLKGSMQTILSGGSPKKKAKITKRRKQQTGRGKQKKKKKKTKRRATKKRTKGDIFGNL